MDPSEVDKYIKVSEEQAERRDSLIFQPKDQYGRMQRQNINVDHQGNLIINGQVIQYNLVPNFILWLCRIYNVRPCDES